jgi:hypothetical protein
VVEWSRALDVRLLLWSVPILLVKCFTGNVYTRLNVSPVKNLTSLEIGHCPNFYVKKTDELIDK